MNAIVPFHSELGEVRVVERDGQPWFVLTDLCQLLGIKNAAQAARPLDATERSLFNIGRQGDATIVSLPGALTLMVRCRGAMKPDTMPYRVRKWITGEVVPQVLRTGAYGRPVQSLALEDLEALVVRQIEHRRAIEDELAPKADAFDRLTDTRGALGIREAAKALKVGQQELVDWLIRSEWAYRSTGSGRLQGYRMREQSGLVEHKTVRIRQADGPDRVATALQITAKGLAKVAETLGARGC